MKTFMKNQSAVELGKLGGAVKSERKAAAVRENGKKARGQKFTIRSEFHPTSINIVAELDTPLSSSQVRRINKALCGMDDCICGGINRASVDGDYHLFRGWYDVNTYVIMAGNGECNPAFTKKS